MHPSAAHGAGQPQPIGNWAARPRQKQDKEAEKEQKQAEKEQKRAENEQRRAAANDELAAKLEGKARQRATKKGLDVDGALVVAHNINKDSAYETLIVWPDRVEKVPNGPGAQNFLQPQDRPQYPRRCTRTRTHARGPSVRRPAPRVDHRTMRYYHATSAAQAILADGFRDWSGSYGLRDVEGTPLILTGVFISDRPLSANDGAPLNWGGAPGHGVFEVTIPDDVDFDDYELIEEGTGYREWCVPSELLNQFPRRLLTDEEI